MSQKKGAFVAALVVLGSFAEVEITAQEIRASVLTGHRESQSRANEFSRFVDINNLAFTDNEGTEGITIQNEPEVNQVYPSCTMATETILAV